MGLILNNMFSFNMTPLSTDNFVHPPDEGRACLDNLGHGEFGHVPPHRPFQTAQAVMGLLVDLPPQLRP